MNDSRTITIIGAGMAGLCVGSYLQMNGYRTQIVELHGQPGGLCTAWDREGYTFDGCIHYLVGSGPANAFHRLWNELIDLDQLQWFDHDEIFRLRLREHRAPDGSDIFHLYSDLDRLQDYLLQVAPEDARPIRRLIGAARKVQRYELPPAIDRAPELATWRDKLSKARLLPALPFLLRWSKITNRTFAKGLRSPFLREAFENLFEGKEFPLVILAMQMAWFDQHSAGYPIGGSLPFIRRFADRYAELGGTIRYRSPVARILVEDDRAVGVELADGTELRSDIVISAADGHFTIFEALGGRYVDQGLRDLYDGKRYEPFPSLLYVSLGLDRTFDESASGLTRFFLDEPMTFCDGTEIQSLDAHVMSFDPTLAPRGKTVLNTMILSSQFEYWSELRGSDRDAYRQRKAEVADRVIDQLDRCLGDIRDHVEVVDVATPATFHRFTNNWLGSYEGWMPGSDLLTGGALSKELPGLSNFYMVGQWMAPGGGLPPAIMHGRHLAQLICHRDGRAFDVISPG